LRRVERESFIKGFLLFFISMSILIFALFFIYYQKELQDLDKELISKMSLCSFTLNCKEFGVDFVPKSRDVLTFHLYKNKKEIYSLYPIKNVDFFLKIYMNIEDYNISLSNIKGDLFIYLIITLIAVFILSIIFSLYSLSPLREALVLTREFVKDILHDVNTPMSTIRLNLSLLKHEVGENKKILRIEKALEKLVLLQDNLKYYLLNHKMDIDTINLKELCFERVEMIERNYPDIKYYIDIPSNIIIQKNRDAFIRILDNIIDNAFKYNKRGGKVFIYYKNGALNIEDTGVGIRDASRVFDRFYKESSGGMGIGLDIVKKLSEELNIKIRVDSSVGIGTTITLKF